MSEPDGWSSPRAAQRLRVQSDMVPGRSEVLALIATLAAACLSPRPAFLDLGCGSGDVTAEILKRRPDAVATLVDVSDEMLKRAGRRFPDDGRVRHVSLTERGRAAIEAGRRHRAALEAELAEKLGPRRAEGARRLLADVASELGSTAAARGRRVRPPR